MIPQRKRRLQRKKIVGICSHRPGLAFQRAGLRVNVQLRALGHLLHTDKDLHKL